MKITVNNYNLDLDIVNKLIANNSKIEAIKHIKGQVNIGLKECKTIVDNLDSNPYYYDGETEITIEHPTLEVLDSHPKSHKHSKKGSHIIEENKGGFKNYVIIALVIGLVIFGYLYINK